MPNKEVEGRQWSGLKLKIKHFYRNRLIKAGSYRSATAFL